MPKKGYRRHTILLVQLTNNPTSRTYKDFESVGEAMIGLCQMFEEKLKKQYANSGRRDLTYDVKDLWNYIDQLPDLGALIYDQRIQAYAPHDKTWIKNRVLKHLQKLAQQQK